LTSQTLLTITSGQSVYTETSEVLSTYTSEIIGTETSIFTTRVPITTIFTRTIFPSLTTTTETTSAILTRFSSFLTTRTTNVLVTRTSTGLTFTRVPTTITSGGSTFTTSTNLLSSFTKTFVTKVSTTQTTRIPITSLITLPTTITRTFIRPTDGTTTTTETTSIIRTRTLSSLLTTRTTNVLVTRTSTGLTFTRVPTTITSGGSTFTTSTNLLSSFTKTFVTKVSTTQTTRIPITSLITLPTTITRTFIRPTDGTTTTTETTSIIRTRTLSSLLTTRTTNVLVTRTSTGLTFTRVPTTITSGGSTFTTSTNLLSSFTKTFVTKVSTTQTTRIPITSLITLPTTITRTFTSNSVQTATETRSFLFPTTVTTVTLLTTTSTGAVTTSVLTTIVSGGSTSTILSTVTQLKPTTVLSSATSDVFTTFTSTGTTVIEVPTTDVVDGVTSIGTNTITSAYTKTVTTKVPTTIVSTSTGTVEVPTIITSLTVSGGSSRTTFVKTTSTFTKTYATKVSTTFTTRIPLTSIITRTFTFNPQETTTTETTSFLFPTTVTTVTLLTTTSTGAVTTSVLTTIVSGGSTSTVLSTLTQLKPTTILSSSTREVLTTYTSVGVTDGSTFTKTGTTKISTTLVQTSIGTVEVPTILTSLTVSGGSSRTTFVKTTSTFTKTYPTKVTSTWTTRIPLTSLITRTFTLTGPFTRTETSTISTPYTILTVTGGTRMTLTITRWSSGTINLTSVLPTTITRTLQSPLVCEVTSLVTTKSTLTWTTSVTGKENLKTTVTSTKVIVAKTTVLPTTCGCPSGDGNFPLLGNCTAYMQCVKGVQTVLSCPLFTVFNPFTAKCDAPYNVGGCECAYPNSASCRCLSLPDGRYPIPGGNCSMYLECGNPIAVFKKCPDGQAFNNQTKQCDDQANVPSCTCNRTPNTPECQCSALHDPSASYPTYSGINCTSFLACNAADSSAIETCPWGLVYNAAVGYCDDPVNVPECTCTWLPTGLYGISGNCTGYGECSPGTGNVFSQCPPGLVFDNVTKVCGEPGSVEGCQCTFDISPDCQCGTGSVGSLAPSNPLNCSTYVTCGSGVETCPSGLYFNPATEKCEPLENVPQCYCNVDPSSAACLCQGRPDGIYPVPGSCTQYMSCGVTDEFVTCPPNQVFNNRTYKCDAPEKVPGCECAVNPSSALCFCVGEPTGNKAINCTDYAYCTSTYGGDVYRKCASTQFFDPVLKYCRTKELVPVCNCVTAVQNATATCQCTGKEQGTYGIPGNCTSYLFCSDETGADKIYNCPATHYFDAVAKTCKTKELVPSCNCVTAAQNSTAACQCVGKTANNYGLNCTSFLRCSDTVGSDGFYTCRTSPNLYFNNVTRSCDTAENVPVCLCQTPQQLASPLCQCVGKAPGSYEIPGNCTSYLFCSDSRGNDAFYNCPTSQYFDAVSKTCKTKELVPSCNCVTAAQNSTAACQCVGKTANNYGLNCTSFLRCSDTVDGDGFYTCRTSPNLYFNNVTRSCDTAENVPACVCQTPQQLASPLCQCVGKAPGSHEIPGNCTSYLFCSDETGKDGFYNCPATHYFDAVSKSCKTKELVPSCNCVTAQQNSTTACQCTGKATGNYGLNCTDYLSCSDTGDDSFRKCGGTTPYFSNTTKSCQNADSVPTCAPPAPSWSCPLPNGNFPIPCTEVPEGERCSFEGKCTFISNLTNSLGSGYWRCLDGVKNNANCSAGVGTSSTAYGGSCACASGTAFNPVCNLHNLLMFRSFFRVISLSMFPGVRKNIFFNNSVSPIGATKIFPKERLFKINSVQKHLNASNAP
jgi:hypothetical protein